MTKTVLLNCPTCHRTGTISIGSNTPASEAITIKCPRCNGIGKIRERTTPTERWNIMKQRLKEEQSRVEWTLHYHSVSDPFERGRLAGVKSAMNIMDNIERER